MEEELLEEYIKQEFPKEVYGETSQEMRHSINNSLEYGSYLFRMACSDLKDCIYEQLKRKFHI